MSVGGVAKVEGYDAGSFVDVMDRIAGGMSVTEALASPGLPSRPTFYRWLALYPDLRKAYEAARELSAQSFEEELLDMARTLKGDNEFNGTKVRMYEVAMAQLRWSAARRDPKRYGQKQDVGLIVPIQINTTLDLGSGLGGALNLGDKPGALPDDIYKLSAVIGDPIEDVASYEVLGEPEHVLPKKPLGRPLAHKKHKTPAQLRATIAAKAPRKKKEL